MAQQQHKFYSFTFTDKEIAQICDLMQKYTQGYTLPVKRAMLTKNVIQYALTFNLLEERNKRLHFPQGSGFNVFYDLPVEAMWRMVQPMLRTDGSTGYSIVNNALWENLNIYPQNSKYATDKDLEKKTYIILKLSNHHYVHFQMAGSTWCIYPENEK